MKWNVLAVFLGILFISYGVFAAVSISPSDLNIPTMHGGDTREILLTVVNSDSWDNSAHIVVSAKDSNNNAQGFDLYLSNNNIGLFPGQTQYITLTIHAKINIKPDVYVIKVYADGSGYQPDPIYSGGGGGGGSYYNPPHVDTNDNNAPDNNVPVLGGDRDAYGCIPSAGYFWCATKNRCIRSWEELCVTIDNNKPIDNNVVDTNWQTTYIDKPYIPIEWIGGFVLLGCLICGGVIFIYFRLNKPKSN